MEEERVEVFHPLSRFLRLDGQQELRSLWGGILGRWKCVLPLHTPDSHPRGRSALPQIWIHPRTEQHFKCAVLNREYPPTVGSVVPSCLADSAPGQRLRGHRWVRLLAKPLHTEDPQIACVSQVITTESEKDKRASTLPGLPQLCFVSRSGFSRPQWLLIHCFY